jgi:hypothetical protein
MVVVTSLILALLPLLGVVWMAWRGALATVDGLFMSLILLAMSGIIGTTALFDLKKRLSRAPAGTAQRRPQTSTSIAGAGLVQRGKVEKVDFFESNVGQPNKSIVTLSNGSGAGQLLVLEGDMRNALPAGQKVEITFRKASGYNVLVNVNYS